MNIKKFKQIKNRDEWRKKIDNALFKTFFHSLEWEEFLEKNFKWLKFEHYIYQNQAILSLARVKIKGKEKIVSHPFCEYGGILPLVKKIEIEQLKHDLFFQFKNSLKISFHPEFLNYFENEEVAVLSSFKESKINTYFIEGFDEKTKEEIWAGFRKTLRHSMRKAQTQNLSIKKCDNKKDLRSFYNLYLKNAKKHKIPAYPFSFFVYFLNSSDTEIILVKYKNKVIAGSVFLFYNKFIHYFLNASDIDYKSLYPNHLILWEQIQNYVGKDYKVFDFGGTRVGSSLEVFKQGWGTKEYPIFEMSNHKSKNNLRNSKLRKIFGILPCFVIEKISPYLLKYKV